MINEKFLNNEERLVQVPSGPIRLPGSLGLLPDTRTIVVFAHVSGSSRLSPRNQFFARVLREAGIGTLLLDLLTPQEESSDVQIGHHHSNIPLLAKRLARALDWLQTNPETAQMRIGCFGAGTGTAAALMVAAMRPDAIQAIVSRDGRPDLAGPALHRVRAPTLLIVGGDDPRVIDLNRQALVTLEARQKEFLIIKGATHLFEEPGTLEEVAQLAANWFSSYLIVPGSSLSSRVAEREARLWERVT